MNCKSVAHLATLALLFMAASNLGFAQSESHRCNSRLIAGNYGFILTGNKLAGNGPVGPQVGVAMTHFDGDAGLTQIDTVTVAGKVVADFTHTPATGTYSVNPDCTGTFTLDFTDGRPPVVANFLVVKDGMEIDAVVISAGGEQGIIAVSSIGKRLFARR
ncbi:MAG TPA: hypothetical protein VH350_04765 [Candidatus Sulfotelmatobacter sp.]|jgi:hypothetical protein|nr:hypothetical protein [Candidatus Sulfotelmatobacter sp.]